MKKPNRTPLAVGERVRVYGFAASNVQFPEKGATGRVIRPDNSCPAGYLTVEFFGQYKGYTKWVSPKQCRRLKPRPAKTQEKRERAETWKILYPNGGMSEQGWKTKHEAEAARNMTYGEAYPVIHLIELREGEIPLSRGALIHAWKQCEANCEASNVSWGIWDLCSALGLGDSK